MMLNSLARKSAILQAQLEVAHKPVYLDTETTGLETADQIVEICILDVMKMTTITTPIPGLTDSLQRRTLALFIGADLPRAITGLPSRADLARELAHRHRLDDSLPLAEVAQPFLFRIGGRLRCD